MPRKSIAQKCTGLLAVLQTTRDAMDGTTQELARVLAAEQRAGRVAQEVVASLQRGSQEDRGDAPSEAGDAPEPASPGQSGGAALQHNEGAQGRAVKH